LFLLNRYWGIVTVPGSRGHSLRQGTWGSWIPTLHLNYVAGYTGPLLFLFERTHNYSVDVVLLLILFANEFILFFGFLKRVGAEMPIILAILAPLHHRQRSDIQAHQWNKLQSLYFGLLISIGYVCQSPSSSTGIPVSSSTRYRMTVLSLS
jgi:hypothetical protein